MRVRGPDSQDAVVWMCCGRVLTATFLGENNLSFIETSALDASNVELAFQNILTGTSVSYTQRIAATIVVGAKLGVTLGDLSGHVFTPPLLLSLQPQISLT